MRHATVKTKHIKLPSSFAKQARRRRRSLEEVEKTVRGVGSKAKTKTKSEKWP